MSTGQIFVKADDDNFYKNAEIVGADFFISFHPSNKLPELIILRGNRSDEELFKKAEEIITELKIEATIKLHPGYVTAKEQGSPSPNQSEAFAVFLDITKPIPLSSISKHDGIYDGKGNGTFECFEELDLPAWRKEKFKN